MFTKISQFASSFAALLSDTNTKTIIDIDSRFATIQEAMLACLLELFGHDAALPKVFFDVSRATEIQTLWYLRSDLFGLLAGHCGEQVARDKLGIITELFRGIIPHNQMPNSRLTER
jgi:hypothetical protein